MSTADTAHGPTVVEAVVGNPSARAAAAPAVAYALFTSPTASNLDCLTIDVLSGTITAKLPVVGPAKDHFALIYGETTRVFPYSMSRGLFYFLDIVQTGASPASPITLYAIDPATGVSTAAVVQGASGFVVSFDYHHETDSVVMSTGARDALSFSFWRVNLDTAAATLLGIVDRGASETASPAYYAPYITAMDANGTSAYRLGFQQVTVASNPGLMVTPLGASAGPATWEQAAVAPNSEFLYSMVRKPGSDSFVSLAPSSAANHTLSVVAWQRGDAQAVVMLDMANAHPPSFFGGTLGYVADYTSSDLYVALVVATAKKSTNDEWSLAFVDYSTGAAGVANIAGLGFDKIGAGGVSVSGIGLKA